MIATLVPVLLLFAFAQCDNGVDPADVPRLELTAENVGATEVWLRVNFVNSVPPIDYVMVRDGEQIATGRMFTTDTLLIDATVLPKRSYSYRAVGLPGSSRNPESEELSVMTLDTTSHAVTWIVDTLGVRGTIFDVWAFSSDNIWAVGEIFLRDSTGEVDPNSYNLARWDGVKWEISRVLFSIGNNQGVEIGAASFLIRSIYAFSPSDIWLSFGGGFVHWTGTVFQKACTPVGLIQGELLKIWGTSSNNLYCVGRNGSLARYNGSTWQKMESGTTVDLEDIWGIDGNNIWATGMESDYTRSVILKFDGGYWSTLFDSFGQPRERDLRFSSVWTDTKIALSVAGITGRWTFSPEENLFRRTDNVGTFASYKIRGRGQNDIFVGSQGSELLHFNGSTWYLYPEIKSLGNGFAQWFDVEVKQDYVIVGGEFFTGLFGVPVVLRGNR